MMMLETFLLNLGDSLVFSFEDRIGMALMDSLSINHYSKNATSTPRM